MNLAKIQAKKNQEKISCLTTYDALFARIVDESSVDIALVGDSLGMVVQGGQNTLKVSMDDMLYHTRIVAGQIHRSYLITDMPYQSYQTPAQALKNAQLLCTIGAKMVKIEGGKTQANIVRTLVKNDMAVCGHLGLQPQSIKKIGGYKVQGSTPTQAAEILDDAKHLEQLGIGLLVLECIPATLARQITRTLKIPTIGIGAGANCDGQVLVCTDILGMGTPPKFAQNFLAKTSSIAGAVAAFSQAVKNQTFPSKVHSF